MVKQNKTKIHQDEIHNKNSVSKNLKTASQGSDIFQQLRQKYKKKTQRSYKTIDDYFCIKKTNNDLQIMQNQQKLNTVNYNFDQQEKLQIRSDLVVLTETKNRDFQNMQKRHLYQKTKYSQHTISTLCNEEENLILKKELRLKRKSTIGDSIENSFCNIEGLFQNKNQSEKIQSVKNNFNNIKNDFFSKFCCKRKKIKKPAFFVIDSYQDKKRKLNETSVQICHEKQPNIQNIQPQIQQQLDCFIDPILNLNFILEKKIGCGAFSMVYQARCKSSGQLYAIKTLNNEKLKQQQSLQVVENEIKVLQQINHENIVSLKHVIRSKNFTHLVLKLVQGKNLEDILKEKKTMSLEDSKNIIKQLIQVVQYLHSNRIFHRDLKLANLLLEGEDLKSSKLYLIDFGFSMKVPLNFQIKGFCGTPNYMSPELKQNKLYCPQKAEVWALGIILHQMLTGNFPVVLIQKESIQVQIDKKINQKVKNLLGDMLNVDPQKRINLEQIPLSKWFSNQIFIDRYL